MIEKLKLSIIVPVYNGEKHIENTVRNLLGSSHQNLELLLIDDGSTDGSLALCQKLAKTDSRVYVFHKENGGIGDARNFGLSHVTGDYIGFCDQDDKVASDMYQKMIERIVIDGSQAAVCGAYRLKKNGGTVIFEQFTDCSYHGRLITERLLLPMLFQGFASHGNDEISIYMSIWKCVISKRLIDDHAMQFRTFVTHEDDFTMLLQLFLCAEKISTLSDILYYWNTNSDSETYHSAKKYRSDLEERQRRLTSYVSKQLADHGISRDILNEYLYVQQCRNALQQLDNLAALLGQKRMDGSVSFRAATKNFRNCESVSYIQSAAAIVAPKKGFVRNTVIIWLLRKKHVIAACILNQLINIVRLFVEKHQITEKLERQMKKPK